MATRAHTVPKFLLQGFSSAGGGNNRRPALWVGSLSTGEIKQRGPENVGVVRGLYDGPGGLDGMAKTIEAHLKIIESNAAIAIRRLSAAEIDGRTPIPEIWRFIAWQAARTPGWWEVEQQLIDEVGWEPASGALEGPLAGVEDMKDRQRPLLLQDPRTGEQREIDSPRVREHLRAGWRWIVRKDDALELLHMQAWYFQQRHFPRLSWLQLRPPNDEDFVISDRGVTWLVDGYADTPPAALRNPAAEVIAPLTKKLVLVGRGTTSPIPLTPREVNLRTAFAASDWIAGPTQFVVQQALKDRAEHMTVRELRVSAID